MGVKVSADIGRINDYFKKVVGIINTEMRQTFAYIGEESIKMVRDRTPDQSWIDRTGNLRSSIGYGVYAHGRKEIESTFEIVKQGTQGPSAGRQLLDELSKQYADTYALIVVAGMNYADEVEARDNKDVLASAELAARTKIDSHLKRTQERILKRIESLSI